MRRLALVSLFAAALGLIVAGTALANHAWGRYHWARTANPFTLRVESDVSTAWRPILDTAAADWGASAVLDLTVEDNKATSGGCSSLVGIVRVCAKSFGKTSWVGVAQIWVDSRGHITKGTVRMNDYYFTKSPYKSAAWKAAVMCQELGHTLGLDHQDENFYNADLLDGAGNGTCMDYSNNPSNNQHPNAHDYEQLDDIYDHLDSGSTVAPSLAPSLGQAELEEPASWGKVKRVSHTTVVLERDLGRGERLVTFVILGDD